MTTNRGGMVPIGGPGGWIPGHSMPPLGYGVVPQQPGGMAVPPHLPMAHPGAHVNWQHHQYVASQVSL